MSAILVNAIPIIDWKGQTFNQIVSHIQKNGANYNNGISNNIFAALPLKIYRREIASGDCKNSRNSTTITGLTRPGGSIVNSSSSNCNGLVNIVDFTLINNSSDIPGTCAAECVVGTAATNAKRRVRSSGMIKRQFDLSTDKPKYYTDSRQYLNSRNRTYEQNNFHYFREGDVSATPGSSLSVSNVYTTNTTTDCKRHYISNDTLFNYQWVAGNPTFASTGSQPTNENGDIILESAGQYGNFVVNLKKGYYDVDNINAALHTQMILNEHYFVNTRNSSKRFFINFVLNSTTKLIELHIDPISQTVIDNEGLVQPTIETDTGTRPPVWNTPQSPQSPIVEIVNNEFKDVIGFTPNMYPDANQITSYVVSSTTEPAIKSRYNRVYYKPNNSQFAQQGAVSSSSRVARLKYNAITNSAASYRNAYGAHVANALAYGVPANGYTIKDKIGYPLPNTPKFTSTGELVQCVNVSISG
jgi:hypothetical protein